MYVIVIAFIYTLVNVRYGRFGLAPAVLVASAFCRRHRWEEKQRQNPERKENIHRPKLHLSYTHMTQKTMRSNFRCVIGVNVVYGSGGLTYIFLPLLFSFFNLKKQKRQQWGLAQTKRNKFMLLISAFVTHFCFCFKVPFS
jgi:hypothetical protein